MRLDRVPCTLLPMLAHTFRAAGHGSTRATRDRLQVALTV